MPGVYQIVAGMHNGAGNFFSNVWAYQLTEAGSADPFHWADALITKFKTSVETAILPLLGSDVVIDFYNAKKVDGTKGPSATQVSGATGGGGIQSVSSQLAADIAWITASSLNRFGRTFLAGVFDGSLIQDVWDPGFLISVAAYVAAQTAVLTLGGALGTATFGVWSRKSGTFNAASAGEIKPKATTMNRRARPRV